MRPLATLEADLWLAQRANRRNPSQENQALIDSIEAEIFALSEQSPTAHTAKVADVLTKPEEPAETKPKKETKPKDTAKKKEE